MLDMLEAGQEAAAELERGLKPAPTPTASTAVSVVVRFVFIVVTHT